jgi:integrase
MNGSIQVKRGFWYAVIYYKDEKNITRQKWINSGLPERGNKRQAKDFLDQELSKFDEVTMQQESRAVSRVKNNTHINVNDRFMLFGGFCEKYIKQKEVELTPLVYHNYLNNYIKPIKAYFDSKGIRLVDIMTEDIDNYYHTLKEKGLSNTSVKHYEDIIRPTLKYAYREKLIPDNPYDFVSKIRRDTKPMTFYNEQEMSIFFEAIKGHQLELLFKVAAYYGLRRSEVLGLRWKAIDFGHKTIEINHKMLMVNNKVPYFSDELKTYASRRTFPLIPAVEDDLLKHKEKVIENGTFFGNKYDDRYLDYVFVNEKGKIYYPNYVSTQFREVIKNNKLKNVHLHELRHSCASILLKNGMSMKQIQEWLGHANYSVTANIYSHLDYSAKLQSASVMENAFSFNANKPVSVLPNQTKIEVCME